MLCQFQLYSKVNQLYIHIHTLFRGHIRTLFQILFPCRSLQSIEQSSLCYTVGSYQLSILYIMVCIYTAFFFGNLPVNSWPPHTPSFISSSQGLYQAHLSSSSLSFGLETQSRQEAGQPQEPFLWDFPGGTVVKNLPASAGDTGSSPGPGRSHRPQSN